MEMTKVEKKVTTDEKIDDSSEMDKKPTSLEDLRKSISHSSGEGTLQEAKK